MVRSKLKRKEILEEESLAKKLFGRNYQPVVSDESDSDGEQSEFDECPIAESDQNQTTAKAVWHDADDEVVNQIVEPLSKRDRKNYGHHRNQREALSGIEYQKRLREKFLLTTGSCAGMPKWAQAKNASKKSIEETADTSEEELEDALLEMVASSGKYIARSAKLPKGLLNSKRLGNIRRGYSIKSNPIHALQFHPTRPVIMAAGDSGTATLYEVGKPQSEEAFLQDVFFKGFPIAHAEFTSDGMRLIASSRKMGYFMTYDLCDGKVTQIKTPLEVTITHKHSFCLSPDGKYIAIITLNEVHTLTASSFEYIGVFVAPVNITSVQFSPIDSNEIFVMGESGQVFIWSITGHKLLHRFDDEGAVRGTTLRISNDGRFLGCGSNTGIVNLYEADDVMRGSNPVPYKVIDNLTTSVSGITFNGDAQICAVSSNVKRNAIRLVHTASRSVFSNFPQRDANIGRPTAAAFSPHSGYFATADDRGFLTLFRLLHFNSY